MKWTFLAHRCDTEMFNSDLHIKVYTLGHKEMDFFPCKNEAHKKINLFVNKLHKHEYMKK